MKNSRHINHNKLMKSDNPNRFKGDCKFLVHSESGVYIIMGHEKYEKKSIPVSPNTLKFISSSYDECIFLKLYLDKDGNRSPEFLNQVKIYYSYTTISFVIILLFTIFVYKEGSISGSFLVINIIFQILLLLGFCLLLYFIITTSYFLYRLRESYLVLVMIKLIYYALLDQGLLCQIETISCTSNYIPVYILMLAEIQIIRGLMFHSYYFVTIIGFFINILSVVMHLSIYKDHNTVFLSKLFVFMLFTFVQVNECYRKDFRIKQIYWRGQQEDKAFAFHSGNKSKKNYLSSTSDRIDLKSVSEKVLKNLKYISNVIIYRDANQTIKDSIKYFREIKKIFASRPYEALSKIQLPKELDEEDYAFIAENFMEPKTNDSVSAHTPTALNVPSRSFTLQGPSEIQNLLCLVGKSWNFDIFFLQDRAGKCLSILSSHFMKKWNIYEELSIIESVSNTFFEKLEESYLPNPYHNSCHAGDVLHNCLYFLQNSDIIDSIEVLDLFSVIVSCLGHDAGHLGLTNRYLINTKHDLSMEYNDSSVLENMHCCLVFKLLNSTELLDSFPSSEWSRFRKICIEMILSTDMIKHFDVVQRFQNRAVNLDNIDFDKEEDRILVLVMAIKCGDIGHHAKDLDLHIKWSTLAAEELFKQGDQEREQGLNVSIYCDRDISNMVKTNIGIIKNICLPLYEIWSYYLKSNEINECVIVHAKENLAYWQSCCKDRTNTTALKYFPLELKRQLILYQTERK